MRIWFVFISLLVAVVCSAAVESAESSPAPGVRKLALFAPMPVYPDSAKTHDIGGHGVFVMHVDLDTGLVRSVEVKQSTGVALLDRCAVEGFRRWRFIPKTVSKVACPITFVPHSPESDQAHLKPTMIAAPRPEYPEAASVRHVSGCGLYRIDMNTTTGAAVEIEIIQSAGNVVLNSAAVNGLMLWRARPGGPSNVNVPVCFELKAGKPTVTCEGF